MQCVLKVDVRLTFFYSAHLSKRGVGKQLFMRTGVCRVTILKDKSLCELTGLDAGMWLIRLRPPDLPLLPGTRTHSALRQNRLWKYCTSTTAQEISPFEQVGGGDKASAGGAAWQFLGLPPEGVSLVYNLQNVAPFEAHAGVGTGDGRILLRAVVGHGPYINLTDLIF